MVHSSSPSIHSPSNHCCTVAHGVQCRPSLALFQELQRQLPMPTFLTSTDCCIVAGRVRPNPFIAHGLQESKSTLPLATFFASTDCCAVADGVRCRPSLALFQELKRQLPMLTFLTSTDGCIVADRVRPNLLIAHSLQERKHMLPLNTFFARRCALVAHK